ncbi:hypothetical protein L291_3393 [Acinetobacter guillouiae MSP4-18]|nr:hypothetical protein L291_3393 [Acinetobacter guillouiae MSP4-18]
MAENPIKIFKTFECFSQLSIWLKQTPHIFYTIRDKKLEVVNIDDLIDVVIF